jgi:predicted SprT family Zn-dependent metalloprotease
MATLPPSEAPSESELTAALQAALVRELRAAWRQLNETYFHGGLTAPAIELRARRGTLGAWHQDTRTLEISLSLVVTQPWGAVIEVLKHEMAHQYVQEILGEVSETPHGRAFREACARLGVDVRASGLPVNVSSTSEHKMVERISRLLALAESPNRHEAEAAMGAAQRLMLKHNLEVATSQATREYSFAHLGVPTGRVLEKDRLVAMILSKHFFVDAIWIPVYRPRVGKRGSILEICGTRSNVAIAEYVHGFLHETAERLWQEHRRALGISSDRDRRTYLAGVMAGFAEKLARQDTRARSEGLVWIGDGDLADYFKRRHPHVRHVRYAGQRRTEAWAKGREAGRSIVLYRPVATTVASRGRLLP